MSTEEVTPTEERDDLEEVTIAIRGFPYYVDVRDLVTGRMVRQERVAMRGETVSLAPWDYQRAVKFNAIAVSTEEGEGGTTPVAAEREPGWDPNTQSLDEVNVEDVSLWISGSRPTVSEVVEEANSDPDRAQKLLDGERHATGDQPRSTLIEQLEEIINE